MSLLRSEAGVIGRMSGELLGRIATDGGRHPRPADAQPYLSFRRAPRNPGAGATLVRAGRRAAAGPRRPGATGGAMEPAGLPALLVKDLLEPSIDLRRRR